MIITVFGDVHGNLVALEKMLALETLKTDLFICHGDVVNYGPWSNECVELLDTIGNIKILKGNHEEYFISGIYPGENAVAKAFFNFCFPKLKNPLFKIIESYKNVECLEHFTIKHTINSQYIFKDTDISNLKIDNNYIIGHSHQQYEIDKGHYKIYNTGSLGQNRKFINQSCYLQIDTETNKVELKTFLFDIDLVINEMKANYYPAICTDYYLSKERL